jgi:peptidyl-prolyl cis-trans isomerase A (cyclophilin A)
MTMSGGRYNVLGSYMAPKVLAITLIGFGLASCGTEVGRSLTTSSSRVRLLTSLGEIVIELDAQKAPISTANFLAYVQSGFYEDTIFHRVIPYFLIQGGGYDENMNEKEEGLREPIASEWGNGLRNLRGSVAVARARDPNSGTAQFYINVEDNPDLDVAVAGGAGYTVFGRVVTGMDTVDRIRFVATTSHPNYIEPNVVPVTPVVIISATLVEE